MSELQKNIWFKGGDTLLLNAFISSTVLWKDKNAKITQHTEYPDELTSALIVDVVEPTAFKLMIKEKAVKAVKINSVPVELKKENGYIAIERLFHGQDTIEIEIDASLHLVQLQGSESLAAIMFGKVLLAQLEPDAILKGISNRNVHEKFIRLEKDKLEFSVDDEQGNRVKFIPLFRVEEEEYSVYLDFKGDSNPNGRFSFAKDGSAAYQEA